MKNLLFSVFAIAVAAVAAMTATTAMLNAPRRAAPATLVTSTTSAPSQSLPEVLSIEAGAPAEPDDGDAEAPAETSPAGKSAAGGKGEGAAGEPEGDVDPYAGIAEEELPPDLQYSADSSVSFPTNI